MTTHLVEQPTVTLCDVAPLQEIDVHETVKGCNIETSIEAPPKKWFWGTRPNPFREPEGCFLEMRGLWLQAKSDLLKGRITVDNILKSNYR